MLSTSAAELKTTHPNTRLQQSRRFKAKAPTSKQVRRDAYRLRASGLAASRWVCVYLFAMLLLIVCCFPVGLACPAHRGLSAALRRVSCGLSARRRHCNDILLSIYLHTSHILYYNSKPPNMSTGAGRGEVFVVAQLTKQVQACSLQRGCCVTVCV